MSNFTKQMEMWASRFGKEYTDRNPRSLQELESVYKEMYGITRAEMNARFIGEFDKDVRVLEIGSGTGMQLLCLQEAGFKNLYGIELQPYAVELAKSNTRGINIIQGSAFYVPFRDGFFDLVFTSGLLIHIAPEDIGGVLDEIYRCTKSYVWHLEYYSPVCTSIPYCGHENLLWKTDFAKLFLNRFQDLRLVKEEYFKWLANASNIDAMFLLRKV
ncbi:MAG: pseudaminic acid biosynthesis-associated methylase [Dehalococcoidia bacterium]